MIQVVAVRGVNPSGHCIVASEVIGGLPLPLQHTEMQKLQEFSPQAGLSGINQEYPLELVHMFLLWMKCWNVVTVNITRPGIIADDYVGDRAVAHNLCHTMRSADYQGLSVVIASGPYTSYENLLYEPLQALLDYCTATPPHLLLLLGPFVDGDHPLVQAGLIDETFEELFDSRVSALPKDNIYHVARHSLLRVCHCAGTQTSSCLFVQS